MLEGICVEPAPPVRWTIPLSPPTPTMTDSGFRAQAFGPGAYTYMDSRDVAEFFAMGASLTSQSYRSLYHPDEDATQARGQRSAAKAGIRVSVKFRLIKIRWSAQCCLARFKSATSGYDSPLRLHGRQNWGPMS